MEIQANKIKQEKKEKKKKVVSGHVGVRLWDSGIHLLGRGVCLYCPKNETKGGIMRE